MCFAMAPTSALHLPASIAIRQPSCCRSDGVRMMADEELDWREMRARLVAQEKSQSESAKPETTPADEEVSPGYVYESPLIEQGTVLLGGTKQLFGFALRQQFFHKCVLLLLQHDDTFTKGIILNRPSAIEIDDWRVWCGHGQVRLAQLVL